MKLRVLLVTALLLLVASPMFAGGPSANPPCPQIGYANGCNLIITLNPNGTFSAATTGELPYDGIEDQLVGVINNSTNITLHNLGLSGSYIFGFDGDGAGSGPFNCDLGGGSTYGCPYTFGPTGYEGPNISFTITDYDNGIVNFLNGGIAPGGTAWFSLEEQATVGQGGVTVTGTNVPEPASMILMASGLLVGVIRRRVRK